MRNIPAALPAADDLDSARLILRDGTSATVRPAEPHDKALIVRFFHDLSVNARWHRFFSLSEPDATIIGRLIGSGDPRKGLSLIALRSVEGDARIVAVASYVALTGTAAEVSFAVDDRFQGKGISTLLLERLAVHAADAGFRTFHASMLADNLPMRDVFRDSAFEIRSTSGDGVVELQLTLSASANSVATSERRRQQAAAASIRPLLEPRSIAVIGASRDPSKIGSRVLRALQKGGYNGRIFPVHPVAPDLGGLPAVPSARDLPPGLDLAIVAVPYDRVLAIVDDCAAAGVKSLVVISAGFAETGPEGRARQDALTERVRAYGMRMIGPNCMGILNTDPAFQLDATFAPTQPIRGGIGFLSQSGAMGAAILNRARQLGLGISMFASMGNKADVSGNDLLEYWEQDPDTKLVLMYLENFGNPRKFTQIARRITRRMPVIAVKSGRTAAGAAAAASHTGALAAGRDYAVDALLWQ
ncbi:MAG TPA: GNAT family N-acetyltransferase, partial [Vicinamibacterales bacterium]|nr:GNAT family N-acetyltransferase [Vicinamibacterales bacterium]